MSELKNIVNILLFAPWDRRAAIGILTCDTCAEDIPAGKPYSVWHKAGGVYCDDTCRCAAGYGMAEQHDAQEARKVEG